MFQVAVSFKSFLDQVKTAQKWQWIGLLWLPSAVGHCSGFSFLGVLTLITLFWKRLRSYGNLVDMDLRVWTDKVIWWLQGVWQVMNLNSLMLFYEIWAWWNPNDERGTVLWFDGHQAVTLFPNAISIWNGFEMRMLRLEAEALSMGDL